MVWSRPIEGTCTRRSPSPTPQIDRSRSASEQEEDDLFVRVVKELDSGVIVRGAKMIGTAAVFGDEVIVGTIEPLAESDVDYALSFSVPIDTPA